MLHAGAEELDVDMGSGLIEGDVDVVDEDPDEADAPFFVDELEDSREGDDPSEAETINAYDPVQILTRLQALRIVYGKSTPKQRDTRAAPIAC